MSPGRSRTGCGPVCSEALNLHTARVKLGVSSVPRSISVSLSDRAAVYHEARKLHFIAARRRFITRRPLLSLMTIKHQSYLLRLWSLQANGGRRGQGAERISTAANGRCLTHWGREWDISGIVAMTNGNEKNCSFQGRVCKHDSPMRAEMMCPEQCFPLRASWKGSIVNP